MTLTYHMCFEMVFSCIVVQQLTFQLTWRHIMPIAELISLLAGIISHTSDKQHSDNCFNYYLMYM